MLLNKITNNPIVQKYLGKPYCSEEVVQATQKDNNCESDT